MGNVRVRKYPDGDWTTYTVEGQHMMDVEPGVYEYDFEDVPAVDGVHHGYSVSNYDTSRLYAVPSYHYEPGVGVRHITVTVRYTANDS